MRKSITVVTPEAADLVTLSAMKAFLRVDGSDEDDIITEFIAAATEEAKNYTKRSLINRTLKFTLDRIPPREHKEWWDGVRQASISVLHGDSDSITLPFPNLQSVTSFVTYDDADNASTFDASNYGADTAGARIYLKQGDTWPSDLRDHAAIEITYVSGYGATAADVPSSIISAVKMHVMEMYEMRKFCDIPAGSCKLLSRYRIMDGLSYNG